MNLLEILPTVIGAAAIAPALLLLWLVIAADERPGPAALVWAAFVLGAASVLLVGFARVPFASLLNVTEPPWLALILRSVFGIAAPEELVKIAAIAAVAAMRRKPADPMDAVVYGAAAGLGFAAYENLAYLMQHADIWRSLAVLRSVLTVPFPWRAGHHRRRLHRDRAFGHHARCAPPHPRLDAHPQPRGDHRRTHRYPYEFRHAAACAASSIPTWARLAPSC